MIRQLIFLLPVILLIIFSGCSTPAMDDYSNDRFELVNQDGETVTFPGDFQGSPLVVGFIYTNCPDICSFITANVGSVYEEMNNPGDTQFVLITFDPQRDTPDVLKGYAGAFDMDREPFHFLTGDAETIEALMERVSVRTQESYSKDLENGERLYFINHSDKILLIDQNSQLIFDYGGSMTPIPIIVEDLNKLL
ncbi:SCO family protein [Rhodohalobacter mucosus]|uniref:SCO family protein n=1 Tax=Rhodohalobacter mucosus TaxID=2079485 RepID=A0A316TYF9_9BACT|nr:SCO family protein [Rhodohalobacter mucosus]PWN07912.1 SCO family protein [Rhodohalobacter mucosus]